MPSETHREKKMNILEDRIRALRQRWAQTLPDRVASIGGMLMHAAECGCDRAELLRQFHTLAGTASTFGYEDIATLAWDAECFLSTPSAPEVTPAEVEHLVSGLVDLETVIRRHVEVGDESTRAGWSTFEGGGVI
jgi:chemotaxis protein histidine kinase CheA